MMPKIEKKKKRKTEKKLVKEDKIQKELINDAIILIAGKHADELINYMDLKNYTNEFIIAKKIGITINQLRNILYKLSDEGIVSSVRKKDKRKGWYTYFWKIEILRTLDFLKEIIKKRMEQINNQIDSRKKKNFYVCERCKIELSEENALLQDFICSECGEVFTMKDNSKLLRELSKNLEKQKEIFDVISIEIIKEKEKAEKRISREIEKGKKISKAKSKKVEKKSFKKIIKPKSISKEKSKKKKIKKKIVKKSKKRK